VSDGGCVHFDYPLDNLIWHCENTPPSAYSQLREEILNFPFDRPDSCFRISHWKNLFVYVPWFLSFIKGLVRFFFGCMIQCIEHIEQPIDDADEIYNKKLAMVLYFFSSKLHLYYSSSRLTLLLTFLSTSKPRPLRTDHIPLPSRLKIVDEDALDLYATAGWYPDEYSWHIFQGFLNSDDPLALEERRYSVAALACLKILFGYSQLPVSRITWFSQHSRALRWHMEDHSQWHHKDHPLASYRRPGFYWYLRTRHRNQTPQKQSVWNRFLQFDREFAVQDYRSNHLLFLLRKSAYSANIINFSRYRVFRFGYIYRKHPTYIRRAIFALAKYVERVTGEAGQVRICESIWGGERWFSAQ